MGFYGSNDPTKGVEALKEDRVLRIRLQYQNRKPVADGSYYFTNTQLYL